MKRKALGVKKTFYGIWLPATGNWKQEPDAVILGSSLPAVLAFESKRQAHRRATNEHSGEEYEVRPLAQQNEYDPTCVLCERGEEPGHEH